MNKILTCFTQALVLSSGLLLMPSVYAQEDKLLIDNNGKAIYFAHPVEQIVSEQEHFYAFWVSQAAQCKADKPNKLKSLDDSNQPPTPSDFLCLLRSRQSLGKEWRRYLIDVSSAEAGGRDPKDEPPKPESEPVLPPKKPKIHWQECVLNTSAIDKNVASCALQLK